MMAAHYMSMKISILLLQSLLEEVSCKHGRPGISEVIHEVFWVINTYKHNDHY